MLINGDKIQISHQKLQKKLCFPLFLQPFEVNFLRLVSDLKKGMWGKNVSQQAANSYREISAQLRKNYSDS
jgi:hypothetical protein